jgi:hypoxanthine phosphoribosyltransferase
MQDESLIQVGNLWFKPIISEDNIKKKISEMGARLGNEFRDKNPILVGILNGCFIFMADLVRAMNIPCEIAFLRLKSYDGLTSSGKMDLILPSDLSFKGRTVLLVEDIVDSGKTLAYLYGRLQSEKVASLSSVALLYKPSAGLYPITPDYHCFSISNEFVIGYGLDYMEQGRQLSQLYQRTEKTKHD